MFAPRAPKTASIKPSLSRHAAVIGLDVLADGLGLVSTCLNHDDAPIASRAVALAARVGEGCCRIVVARAQTRAAS